MFRLALLATIALSAIPSCKRHSVPQGGECSKVEDCDKGSFACLIEPGKTKGFCTATCSDPHFGAPTGEPNCRGGLVCTRHETEHPSLGALYCDKPGAASAAPAPPAVP